MRVVVTIQHPGHVHFFRHAIAELSDRGHEVHVFARESEVAVDLLERLGIDHEVLAGRSSSLGTLALVQAAYELRLLRRCLKLEPDVITAVGGVAATHVARVVGARSVVFYDTEHASLVTRLAYPFADVVCTPASYREDVGSKQVRYPGTHELAYLHPERFEPDPTVLDEVGVDPDESLAVARFSGWNASHDVGQGGFDDPHDVVERLEAASARVVLTAEDELPPALEPYRMPAAADRLHDLLALANVVVSEGATTAAEAAVLGTPAVYVNTQTMGYTDELERYGILFGFDGTNRSERGIERATSILETDESRWLGRRDRLLAESVDVTDVVVEAIEGASGAREVRHEATSDGSSRDVSTEEPPKDEPADDDLSKDEPADYEPRRDDRSRASTGPGP